MVGLCRESGGDLVEHRLVEALLHTPGEQPEPEPIGVEVEQASHPLHEAHRVGDQPLLAVEHVLQCVVGAVADVGLGVDHQPRFTLGGEDVAAVQIGTQQHGALR